MNSILAGARGFLIALVATFLLGALLLGVVTVLDDDGDTSSIAGTLPQTEGSEEPVDSVEDETTGDVGDGAATSDEGVPIAGRTLDDLIDELEADGLASPLEVYLGRDPFQPVVLEPEEDTAGDGTTGDGTTGDGTTGDGTTGDGTTGGGTTGGGTTGGGTGTTTDDECVETGEEAVCDGVVITLIDITDDGQAIIEIGGTRFTLDEGDIIGGVLLVQRIDEDSGCAFLVFGDEAFTICEGTTVLK